MKRFVSLFFAVVLVFALVGCGKSGKQIIELTLSTEDSEAIMAAAGIMLPDVEETTAANTTVKWFSWWDSFHNYRDDEVVNTGYWTFTEKYGCDLEWIECTWDKRFDDLANLILAGDSPDFYPGEANTFPIRPIKGVFQPVDTYVDYDDPLWKDMKDYIYKYFSIKGRPYIIGTDNAFGNVCAYNRRIMDDWGFDDPAELYANDEWTWDVFAEMCKDFSSPDDDRYALDGWGFCSGLMHSCGDTMVVYNTETQRYESNLDSPAIERAANFLYDLSKNQCIWPRWNHGWALRNETEGAGMKEGLCLFYIRGDYVFTGPVETISAVFGDITENELMFVPLPRDPNGDGNYYTESSASGYCIVKGASNPEGVALLASCDRFKVLDPTVINIDRRQKEEIYLWTDEMLEMWDECYRLSTTGNVIVTYDAGIGDQLSTVIGDMEGCYFGSIEPQTWAQLKEANSEKVNYYIDDLNKQIDEFDPDAAETKK